MSDKALLWVAGYLLFAFVAGVLIGKSIKWGQRCIHVWEDKGYGGAGWTLKVCRLCGKREINS